MASLRSIDPNEFDVTVKPADDFFRYVNGGWLAKNPIPAEESRWGSFYVLGREAIENLKKIVDELVVSKDIAPGSDAQKIRDFYLTGMDFERRNRLGVEPLAGILKLVDDIKDIADLSSVIGQLHRLGIGVFWAPIMDQDEKKSEVMALHLYQGGLSLPDRDYYLNDDEKSTEIRGKYLSYANGLLGSMGPVLQRGDPTAPILQIETRLAKTSRTRVELRDVEKQYNKFTASELMVFTPNVAWKNYFAAMDVEMPEYVIVGQPEFFKEVDVLFGDASLLADMKEYMRWHILNELAGFLGETFENQQFDFYGRTFRGTTEMKPQWRRVLDVVNSMLDEALGKLYVERHFSEDAKKKVNVLVDRLVAAFSAHIKALDWMGEETKTKALEKLGTFSRKLGYPDTWKDFSPLAIGADLYVDNYMKAHAFEFDRQMKKIGKSVDRTEWLMPPQMVNAYYQPTMNEIAFPAAILQPPFFDPNADDALNFGGIGSVIGHELTHGFDDQGALFDPQGNVKNWWTEDDKERFDGKASLLATQFDAYEPLAGLHVNGKLTLGENIADLGGLIIAFDALQLALAEKSPAVRDEKIDGLTQNQRFFINFAIAECGHARDEALRLQVQIDPHSPSKYRVNGPCSNMPQFYETFNCKSGDALWRSDEERVKIW